MAKLLYLEDEIWQVKGTVIVFIQKELRHSVTLVNTNEQAIRELNSTKYDAVLLDIMMVLNKGAIQFENSGLYIAQLIIDGRFNKAGNPSDLPLIVASGVWDTTIKDEHGSRWTVEDLAKSMGISHNFFLRKPFLVDEVRDVLSNAGL